MYSMYARINAISALATSVLMGLLAAVALTTFIIPNSIQPATIKVNNLNVVYGRSPQDPDRRDKEYAFARFDIKADLTPLFNWNTKQLFLTFLAEYETPGYPSNQVVIWDRIVRRKRDARVNVENLKNKYQLKDISDSFRNVTTTFTLQYNVMPHVGLLTYGEAGRTEPMIFPPSKAKV